MHAAPADIVLATERRSGPGRRCDDSAGSRALHVPTRRRVPCRGPAEDVDQAEGGDEPRRLAQQRGTPRLLLQLLLLLQLRPRILLFAGVCLQKQVLNWRLLLRCRRTARAAAHEARQGAAAQHRATRKLPREAPREAGLGGVREALLTQGKHERPTLKLAQERPERVDGARGERAEPGQHCIEQSQLRLT